MNDKFLYNLFQANLLPASNGGAEVSVSVSARISPLPLRSGHFALYMRIPEVGYILSGGKFFFHSIGSEIKGNLSWVKCFIGTTSFLSKVN